jgi:hypothetical protein
MLLFAWRLDIEQGEGNNGTMPVRQDKKEREKKKGKTPQNWR